MRKFSKYILGKFYRTLIISTTGFMSVFILAGLIKRLDEFSQYHATAGQILTFLAYKSPQWFLQVFPISILLAQVITVTELKRKNELIAIETSGVSIIRIIKPFFLSGILFCLLIFSADEFAAIKTTKKAYEYYNVIIKGEKKPSYSGKYFNIVMRGRTKNDDDALFFIGFFDSEKNAGGNFSADIENAKGIRNVYAKSFIWKDIWILKDVTERNWNKKNELTEEKHLAVKKYDFPQKPGDFLISQASYEEMNIFQLKKHIDELKEGRVDSYRERVNFHARISSALSALVVITIGLPVGIYFSSVGRMTAVVLSVFISFVYWGCFSLGISFAENAMIPPFVGAWAANIVFIALAVFFIRNKLEH